MSLAKTHDWRGFQALVDLILGQLRTEKNKLGQN